MRGTPLADDLTPQDRQRIEEGIRGKYVKVAVSPEGLFRYPTGRTGLETLNYDPKIVQALPEVVANAYCGGWAIPSLWGRSIPMRCGGPGTGQGFNTGSRLGLTAARLRRMYSMK